MSVKQVEVEVTLAKGPAVSTQTKAPYSHTVVVVTDAQGTVHPAFTLTDEVSFTAVVAEGEGNIVATDYDADGKVLNTVTQYFDDRGTKEDYTPTNLITVSEGKVPEPKTETARETSYENDHPGNPEHVPEPHNT